MKILKRTHPTMYLQIDKENFRNDEWSFNIWYNDGMFYNGGIVKSDTYENALNKVIRDNGLGKYEDFIETKFDNIKELLKEK